MIWGSIRLVMRVMSKDGDFACAGIGVCEEFAGKVGNLGFQLLEKWNEL